MKSLPVHLAVGFSRIRSVRKESWTQVQIAVLVTVLLIPVAAQAAEISYLPGVNRSAAGELGLEPSLALLTWELPGGLLVVDRVAKGDPVAGGRHIAPAYPAGEWFLVDARARRLGAAPAHLVLNRLEEFGAVHLLGGDFALCEIPDERLSAFLAARFDCHRIPTGPPPAGWERYGERVSAAVERRGLRADPVDVAAFVELFDEAAFQQLLQEISGAVLETPSKGKPFDDDGWSRSDDRSRACNLQLVALSHSPGVRWSPPESWRDVGKRRDRCPDADVHPEPEVHVVGRSRVPAMIISPVIRSRRTRPLPA